MDVERKTIHGDSPVKIDGLNHGFIRILLLRRKGVKLRKAKESVGCPGLGKSIALESRRGRRHAAGDAFFDRNSNFSIYGPNRERYVGSVGHGASVAGTRLNYK